MLTLVICWPQTVSPPAWVTTNRLISGRFFQKPDVRVNRAPVVLVVELVVVLVVEVEVVLLVVELVVLVVVELVVGLVLVVVVGTTTGMADVWKPPETSTPLSHSARW